MQWQDYAKERFALSFVFWKIVHLVSWFDVFVVVSCGGCQLARVAVFQLLVGAADFRKFALKSLVFLLRLLQLLFHGRQFAAMREHEENSQKRHNDENNQKTVKTFVHGSIAS